MSAKVSIILPYFNAVDTLDDAIASIVAQTCKDWELILVNNASTDRSPSIAAAWAAKDVRVVLVEEPVQGVAAAMNTGMRMARGTYIARMDADDISHPDRLDEQLEFMEQRSDIDVLATQVELRSELEMSEGRQNFVMWQNTLLASEDLFLKRFVDAPVALPTLLFRQHLPERYGYFSTGPVPEDFELWLRWMHQGVRFAKLPRPLLVERDHSGRLTRTHPNYSTESFDRVKFEWLAKWLKREHPGRPILALGTSSLCRTRVALLRSEGIAVTAYSDLKRRGVKANEFIHNKDLRPGMERFIISFISQRGASDRIAEFLALQGLVEGRDFLLAA